MNLNVKDYAEYEANVGVLQHSKKLGYIMTQTYAKYCMSIYTMSW